MGVLTDTTVVPPVVSTFFDRKLLRRALPALTYARMAQRRPLSQRNGTNISFRKLTALPLALAPLTEGIPPSGRALAHAELSVSLQQWGDYVTLSDLVQATVEHPILNDANRLLGEQSGQTIDALNRDVHVAGTSVFRGNGVATRALLTTVTHKIDTTIMDRVIRYLDNQNASRYTQMIQPTVKVSTQGIRPAFWAITHPDIIFTLETLAGWVPVEQYASQGPVMTAEKGAYKDIRFLSTTQATVYRGGGGAAVGDVYSTGGVADVYVTTVYAMDACGTVPLEGMSLQNIIKPIGSGGPADPLNQTGTSGWKHTGARVRLEETFMTRMENTAGLVAP